MTELNETALGKSVQQKGLFVKEGQVEVKYFPHWNFFFFERERERVLTQTKKKLFFSNRVLFNEATEPRTFYVSKIGPAYISVYLPIYIHTYRQTNRHIYIE